jgi:hypothetical protein
MGRRSRIFAVTLAAVVLLGLAYHVWVFFVITSIR